MTVARIASDLGVIERGGPALAGPELDELIRQGNAALGAVTAKVSVCARVAPEHKLKIVESLQRQGDVVGYDYRRRE